MFSDMPKPIPNNNNVKSKMAWYFSASAMQNATDANPIIIYGDFSDVNQGTGEIGYLGYYYTYNETLASVNNWQKALEKGVTYKYNCGYYAALNYYGYRNITIYDDRIEIGSGFYGPSLSSVTEDSNYGYMKYFAVFNETSDY